jgi:hypothetical protein
MACPGIYCASRAFNRPPIDALRSVSPGASAAAWSKHVPDYLMLCGVEITTVRTVFISGSPDGIRCPLCGADHAPDNMPWTDVVGASVVWNPRAHMCRGRSQKSATTY